MLNQATIDNLKNIDPDRYRASLLADSKARERLQTIYAFHAELAKVPELVSEPMIGAIRYQWWRDAVDEIYSNRPVRVHEVSTPLSLTLTEQNISRFWVDKLIDGRERDLDPTPFADIEVARTYCVQTSGQLALVAAKSVSSDFDEGAIRKAGSVWGMTGLLRGWGYYHDSMLSQIDFKDLLFETQNQYDQIRSDLKAIAPELFPAIGYIALVPGYLKRLSSKDHDPKLHSISYSTLRKQFRLITVAFSGNI